MTENDLIAKVAEIEGAAKEAQEVSDREDAYGGDDDRVAAQLSHKTDLADANVGTAIRALPPGLLSAMARVAVAKMVGDMTGEAAALSAFRTLLEGAKP